MKKVAVAMSGGVDSTMAAYILKKKGYAVTGFYLRLKFPGCLNKKWKESEGKAFSAAKIPGIPLYVVDGMPIASEKAFKYRN